MTEKESDRVTPALSEVWEINSTLEPLWHELSCCISKIEAHSESTSEIFTPSRTSVSKPSGVMPPLPAGSQNILPYIESFFVVCEKLHPAQPGASHDSSIPVISDVEYASTSATQQKVSGPAVKVDEKNVAFVRWPYTGMVGKALFDGQLLDVHFTRSFYKHILGVKVTYHDIEAIDPDYFKNLKWMLENDISDVLDLTFSIDADEEKLILYERTEVTDYELIPGGRNIKVTDENKHQYVDLVAEHRLTTAIRPQINAFWKVDDLRANTEYSGYSAASPVIQWFWEVVQGFSKEDKARLLQFVTGTSKVCAFGGFCALQGISGSQKFQIHKAYGSPDHLPSAHTCFNQLDLPEYPSKQHLEERLLLAIHEANEGFGFLKISEGRGENICITF
ncbi:HECT, E3 ligase catalytic domain [Sesbania bispinosa]|nr:HECT, E3 ligase catalytic domain [Sesbania bispinosa]